MAEVATVYLDTQDYSRLADAEAGRGRGNDFEVLKDLRGLKAEKRVRFVYSAMNLSELLQYDGGGRDLTLRKAAMVESLAGQNAFFDLGKLLALQVAVAITRASLCDGLALPDEPISPENGWYPEVGDIFSEVDDFRKMRAEMIDKELAGMPLNRKQKRASKVQASRMKVGDLPASSFDAMTRKYPFSRELFTINIARYFDGKISKVEAQRALLREMGDPQRFVRWYFEINEGERSFPSWMRGVGEGLARAISKMREDAKPFVELPESAKIYRQIVFDKRFDLPRLIVGKLEDQIVALGIPKLAIEAFKNDDATLVSAPFFSLWSALMPDFLMAHSAFHAHARKPRGSDGADLLHAVTLPYCDLWRGDAYFSDLLQKHRQPGDAMIISRLEELPTAIEQFGGTA